MPVTHRLKTLPVYWDAVGRWEKNFEIRFNDRAFQKGDIVELVRYDPKEAEAEQAKATKAALQNLDYVVPEEHVLQRVILWILTGGQFGLEPGYVILSLGYHRG